MGATRDAPTIMPATSNGEEAKLAGRSAFGGIVTKRAKTIQTPASAPIASIPAAKDHARAGPLTGLARSRSLRWDAVLRGGPLPPRYCHASHKTVIIAGR